MSRFTTCLGLGLALSLCAAPALAERSNHEYRQPGNATAVRALRRASSRSSAPNGMTPRRTSLVRGAAARRTTANHATAATQAPGGVLGEETYSALRDIGQSMIIPHVDLNNGAVRTAVYHARGIEWNAFTVRDAQGRTLQPTEMAAALRAGTPFTIQRVTNHRPYEGVFPYGKLGRIRTVTQGHAVEIRNESAFRDFMGLEAHGWTDRNAH